MTNFNMRLGIYRFLWNPNKMTIPDEKKTVVKVDTYTGSALFQWESFLEGTEVTLWWSWMSVSQYNAIRAIYLSLEPILFDFTPTRSFLVYPVDFEGTYIETVLEDQPYRTDVSLVLNIREEVAVSTTTTQ